MDNFVRFLSKLENELCTLESSMDDNVGDDACTILESREDTRKVLRLLSNVLSTSRLDRRDRRILYMYTLGYSLECIGTKIGIRKQSVSERVSKLPSKILHSASIHILSELWNILQAPQSTKEAGYAQVKLGLSFDSARDSYNGSQWGKEHGKKAWKTKVHCEVPKYFHESFGDDDTSCGWCGIQCTNKGH